MQSVVKNVHIKFSWMLYNLQIHEKFSSFLLISNIHDAQQSSIFSKSCDADSGLLLRSDKAPVSAGNLARCVLPNSFLGCK